MSLAEQDARRVPSAARESPCSSLRIDLPLSLLSVRSNLHPALHPRPWTSPLLLCSRGLDHSRSPILPGNRQSSRALRPFRRPARQFNDRTQRFHGALSCCAHHEGRSAAHRVAQRQCPHLLRSLRPQWQGPLGHGWQVCSLMSPGLSRDFVLTPFSPLQ